MENPMAYFPMFIEIENKPVTVVGGGNIARHKIEVLLQFKPVIKVISPLFCEEILTLAQQYPENLKLIERNFSDCDIEGATFVVAATDDEELNSHISTICQEKNILVNVVDVKKECSFIFPAIVKKEELVIAISTGGSSPALASRIKQEINDAIPDYYAEVAEFLGEHRDYIRTEFDTQKERKQVYDRLIDLAIENQGKISFELLQKVIDRMKSKE
jgi:siroheme synthase-like protein